MLRLVQDIIINEVTFDFVHNVVINSSWEDLTDTCEITLPKKIRFTRDNVEIENIIRGEDALFRRGDDVEVILGYGDQFGRRFRGLVSNISPRKPLVFYCQDEAYLLKQSTIKKYSATKVTLEKLLSDILPAGTDFRVNVSFTIGKILIERTTVAKALEFLRTEYGIISYFREGTLICGLAYEVTDPAQLTRHDIDLEQVGINTQGLEYYRSDDRKVKVTAVSIYPDNTKKEVTVGDEDGGERTQYFYDVSEADLKTYAEEALSKFQYEGFSGSFTTFVNPRINHGDCVKLTSAEIPDANGIYLVKRVTTIHGVNGGRQEVFLDRKIG